MPVSRRGVKERPPVDRALTRYCVEPQEIRKERHGIRLQVQLVAMANGGMAVPISGIGELERYKCATHGVKPLGPPASQASLRRGSVRSKQEFRRVVTLVEERMAGQSIAVQAFKIEWRAARIAQFPRIRMGSQDGPVSRNIVRHELAENRPPSGGVA